MVNVLYNRPHYRDDDYHTAMEYSQIGYFQTQISFWDMTHADLVTHQFRSIANNLITIKLADGGEIGTYSIAQLKPQIYLRSKSVLVIRALYS